MQLNKLTAAFMLISLPSTGVFAAALDRSGQSIAAFLQPNNYFEAGISVLDANVSGKMRDNWNVPSADNLKTGVDLASTNISDMADTFNFSTFALKIQPNEHISLGIIYDQPFGANAKYSANDKKHVDPVSSSDPIYQYLESWELAKNGAFHRNNTGTSVDVSTESLSVILGFQPNQQWNFYAGPVYQSVKGNVQLRGSVYGPLGGAMCSDSIGLLLCSGFTANGTQDKIDGYEAKIKEKSAPGYLAGIAFQIPEIALKTSLTYRSEIKYKILVEETMPSATNALIASVIKPLSSSYVFNEATTKITTPQSINLDFQSGIMDNTLAFINVRWVDWSKFKIRPNKFGQLASGLTQYVANTPRGFDLIAYDQDQFSANFGVARKFNDKWALSLLGGWDSGISKVTSTLGPTDGYWNAGIGAQFSPTSKSFVQAGVKYFWLGDARAQSASWYGTPRYDADFKNNDAIGYSLKIGYKF